MKFTVGSIGDTDSIGEGPDSEFGDHLDDHRGHHIVGEHDDLTLDIHDEALPEDIVQEILDTGVPAPPDGGWGWVIVGAAFLLNLVMDGVTSTIGILLPYIAEDFGAGNGQVALAGSLLCGVSLCVGPIVSGLTNKFGCRIVCVTGCIIASLAFVLSSISPSLPFLLFANGILGGFGFGLMFLPTIVCVSYYFESKRARATGIAVCGSGVGATSFAPLVSILLTYITWREIYLIFAALIAICMISGFLMRPLECQRVEEDKPLIKPLLERMADDKRNYWENRFGKQAPDHNLIQLPDGRFEKRPHYNVDPGVHSGLNLEQLLTPKASFISQSPGVTAMASIPEAGSSTETTVTSGDDLALKFRNQIAENQNTFRNASVPISIPFSGNRTSNQRIENDVIDDDEAETDKGSKEDTKGRGSRQRYSSEKSGVPMDLPASLASFDEDELVVDNVGLGNGGHSPLKQFRRRLDTNASEYSEVSHQVSMAASSEMRMSGVTHRRGSLRAAPSSHHHMGSVQLSVASFAASKLSGESCGYLLSQGEMSELTGGNIDKWMGHSKDATATPIVRPMSRKDIFYSGSIVHLPEFQSQHSFASYRQSIVNLPAADDHVLDAGVNSKVPTFPFLKAKVSAFKTSVGQMMDFSLLRHPIFMLIALSGILGMLGFYVPFVYGIDYSLKQGISTQDASVFISVVGIMNTFGRVFFGMISDLQSVNSLLVNNICILVMGLCVGAIPFCSTYVPILIAYIIFGFALSGFISLTSILLVDLLGLDKLTNAFGLLIFFRGIASILGTPLAGALYDEYGNYTVPFCVASMFLILSSGIMFLIPYFKKYAPPKVILEPREHPVDTRFNGPVLEDIKEEPEPMPTGLPCAETESLLNENECKNEEKTRQKGEVEETSDQKGSTTERNGNSTQSENKDSGHSSGMDDEEQKSDTKKEKPQVD